MTMTAPPKNGRAPLTFEHPNIGIVLPPGAHGEVQLQCPRCVRERKKKASKPLSVNVEKQTWMCHHCGRTGSLIRGWVDAPVERDSYYSPPTRKYDLPKALPPAPAETEWSRLVKYFAERGIGGAVLQRNRVTYAKRWCKVCEEETGHVLFPYYRRGEHVNTKYRCANKHFQMDYNAERILYGYDDVVLPDGAMPPEVIIVEGEIDKLSLEQAGYQHVISVPNGAPSKHTKNFDNFFDFLNDDGIAKLFTGGCKRIVIAVDADEPGERLQAEFVRRFPPEYVYTVTWPDGIKDANDCLKLTSADELRRVIESAEPVPVEGVIEPIMLTSEIEKYYRDGLPRGVSLGWPILDKHITLMPGAFIIVQALSTAGKSSWLNAVLMNIARDHGWGFAVCSPEWQPVALHEIAMLETLIGKPFEGEGRMTPQERIAGEAWLQQFGNFIMPEITSIDQIMRSVQAIILRRGIRVLVIDPFTELEYDPKGDKLEAIKRELTKLKAFGQKHKLVIILVAHPTKPPRSSDGKYGTMGMFGASGSADFANKADFVIELQREGIEEHENAVYIHIEKVRFRFLGKPGMETLYFDVATGRYTQERQFVPMPPEVMS